MRDIHRRVSPGEPSVFAVMSMVGEYEDRYNTIECIYETEEDAVAFVEEKEKWQERIKELSIKDSDDEGDFYYSDKEGECEYTNLVNEFNEEAWKRLFGDRNEDELSEEDYLNYDVEICENYEEKFKKFLISKGYSEEVADATIEYYADDYSSDYRKWYYIEEVSFKKKS